MADELPTAVAREGRTTSVSIAMATCNGERYIRDQLDSLAVQDCLPVEVVITDDASTDRTLVIAREYQQSAPFRMRIHENGERLGYRRNFRKCANLCSGELVFFCDQDDVWEPNKISRMAREFEDAKVLLAYHNVSIMGGERSSDDLLYEKADEEYCLGLTPIPAWHDSNGLTQCFRRSLLAYDRFWDGTLDHRRPEMMAHDQWFMFLALVMGEVVYVDEALVQYRQHENNLYGAERRWGNMSSLGTFWGHFPNADRRFINAASQRADLLRRMFAEKQLSGDRIERLIAFYEDEARLASCRLRAYAGVTLGERFRGFVHLLRAGGYGVQPWGGARAGWPFFSRDLIRGVLMGPWTGI